MSEWAFITNYGLVLAAIAKNPDNTAREISAAVGITERTAHKIIVDLEQAGYIQRVKVGRKNMYEVNHEVPLKTGDAAVGELLAMLGWKRRKSRKPARPRENAD